MILTILKRTALLLTLLTLVPARATQPHYPIMIPVHVPTGPTSLQITTWSLGLFAVCTIVRSTYEYLTAYIDDKINQYTADALVLAATPQHILQETLSKQEYNKALQKKAWLITLRKQVITELEKKYKNSSHLSPQHKNALRALLIKAQLFFLTIDIARPTNPYEKDYQLSSIDSYIIKSIVDSLILSTKPESECSSHELNEKKIQERKKLTVVNSIKKQASTYVVNLITNLEIKD